MKRAAFLKTALLSAVVAAASSLALAAEKKTILIVDMGNIMRSVIAEELLTRKIAADGLSDAYEVDSRGIQGTPASPVVPSHASLAFYNAANGSNAWDASEPALAKLGLVEAFHEHKATVVSEKDLAGADIIVVTDDKIRNNEVYGLNIQFPGYDDKIVLITELVGSGEGIADAYESGDKGNKYEKTVYTVADVIERGYPELMSRLK